jgi:hypothetical protein
MDAVDSLPGSAYPQVTLRRTSRSREMAIWRIESTITVTLEGSWR